MGKLFIISGLPSTGSGKDSVIEGLEKGKLDFNWIITTTTRPRRKGERRGHPYHFISVKKFLKMRDRGDFLEWAEVYGNYYGNTKKAVDEALKKDKPAILRIDCQGVRTYKKLIPRAVVILITVSSLEVLESRMRGRGDKEEVIQKRLVQAKKELDNPPPYDYMVENEEGKLDQTVEKVKDIILKEAQK